MTDKEKIRNYACELLKDSQNGFGSASYNMLKMVISYIDSLHEEPISEDLNKAAEESRRKIRPLFESIRESTGEPVTAYDQNDMIAMFKAGAHWNKDKLDKVIKLADAMYYAAFNMTTDASRLRKAMNDYHNFIIHMNKED